MSVLIEVKVGGRAHKPPGGTHTLASVGIGDVPSANAGKPAFDPVLGCFGGFWPCVGQGWAYWLMLELEHLRRHTFCKLLTGVDS